jgi:hypothetical protein
MKRFDFMKLPEFDDLDDVSDLKIGDKFLYGPSVRGQKQSKQEGQEICYYTVIGKSKMGIEYAPVFDILEKGEEK